MFHGAVWGSMVALHIKEHHGTVPNKLLSQFIHINKRALRNQDYCIITETNNKLKLMVSKCNDVFNLIFMLLYSTIILQPLYSSNKKTICIFLQYSL